MRVLLNLLTPAAVTFVRASGTSSWQPEEASAAACFNDSTWDCNGQDHIYDATQQFCEHFIDYKSRTRDQMVQAATAAAEGRVDTLFVESGRILPGIVDATTGAITFDSNDETDVDDILDDVAEMVLRAKGRVLVLDAEHMPAGTGLAAILRY